MAPNSPRNVRVTKDFYPKTMPGYLPGMIRFAGMVLFIILMFLFLAFGPSDAGAVDLEGNFVQGGLVVGTTSADTRVSLDGHAVRVSADGLFLLGFGRDAKPGWTLRLDHSDGRTETLPLTVSPRAFNIQRIDGLPRKHVSPDPERVKRIRADNAAVGKVRDTDTKATGFANGFVWPTEGRISSVFGSQRILNGEPRSPHKGIDIAAPTGTPVISPADGVVSHINPDSFLMGKVLMIDHGQGLQSIMIHLDDIFVSEGQVVKQGEKVAAVGTTGRSTGPHLHWGVSLFRTALDPELLLN